MKSIRLGSLAPRGALATLLALVLILPSNWGCALFPDPIPPAFDTVSIRTEVERNKQDVMKGDFRAFSTLRGVLVGVATGAPVFAVIGGAGAFSIFVFACAPSLFFYPICVLVATVIGAAGGFVVGLFGGVAVGMIGGLPSKTANEVTEVLAHIEDGRRFDADFLHAMQRAIPEEKQADAADAEGVVTARLEKFDLRQHSKDRLSIRLWASMVQTWQGEDGKSKENTCKYRFDSKRSPAETLLVDGGVAFGEVVTLGMETFAGWMNRDLESFATQTELDKSESEPKTCYRDKRWYQFFRR